MARAPPDFRRQPDAARTERPDGGREKQRLGDGDDLRLEALLRGLGPERREIWRDEHARHDLDVGSLECRDLRREVVGEKLEPAGIDQLVAGLRQRRREAALLVAEGVAVRVVGEHAADHLVGTRGIPQRRERAENVLQAPEEVIGPVEALRRIALAPEEVRLPRTVRGDARHLVDLGLIRDGVRRVGRRSPDDEVHFVPQDQLCRHFGRARGVGLAVFRDDLHGICAAGDLDTLADQLVDALEHERIGLAERCQRPGARAHVTNFDDAALCVHRDHIEDRRHRDRSPKPGAHDCSA